MKNIYAKNTATIRLHKDSEPFQIQKGVRQGDTISPKLFTATLEEIFKQLNWENKGIKIDGEQINHLRFADDIILISEEPEEFQTMLNELNNESKKIGLHMNIQKTKVMFNSSADTDKDITLDGVTIEKVEHYIYLGQKITMESSKEQEITRRISLGWQAFGRASTIFKSKLPLSLKKKAYDQCILPTVTYGAETWNLTKKLTTKLRTMQRAHERIMMGLTWRDKKTAIWIRSQTKLQDIIMTIRELKWSWAGHIARFQDNRWTKKLTIWTPRENTRKKGRPKVRWMDDINQACNTKNWYRLALDRIHWQEKGKAYAQQWANTN